MCLEDKLYNYIINNNFNDFSLCLNLSYKIITPGKTVVNNQTLLIICCVLKKYNFSLKLLETYGRLCNVDYRDSKNFTAIEYIIQQIPFDLKFCSDVLKKLFFTLLNLCNTKTCNSMFRTCIFTGNCNLIELLINSHKIDLNFVNSKGRTFIMYAVQMKLPSIVNKLLDNCNVDLSQKDIYNNTFLSLLLEFLPDKSIIEKILNKNYFVDNFLQNEECKFYDITEFYSCPIKGFQKGGFGQIYPLVNVKTNKTYILKKYHEYINNNHLISDDIVKEALFLKRFNNFKNNLYTSQLLGFVEIEKEFCIVLNSLDLTAHQYFKVIFHSPNYKIYTKNFIKGCLQSLYYLHSFGIIHGDLKSENIMVNNNRVYIIDFGISLFAGFSNYNIKENYISTSNIKAPEGMNFTFICNEKEQLNKKKKVSYSVDIYSLGTTIISIILGTFNQYISNQDKFYEISLEDTKLDYKKFVPLSQNHINTLMLFDDEIFNLLKSMIEYNPLKRPLLKNLLGYERNPIHKNNQISQYTLNKFNKFQKILCNSINHYSISNIENKKYELEYFEEIHNNYKNDDFIIKSSDLNFIKKCVNFLLEKVVENLHFFSVDVLINTIVFLHTYTSKYSCNDINKLLYVVLHIFQSVDSEFYFEKKDFYITDDESKELTELCKHIIKNEFCSMIFKPVLIHIQYIIIKMQIYGIQSILISKAEWFLIKKMYIHCCNNYGKYIIWDLCVNFFIEFCVLYNIEIKIFDFIQSNYKLVEKNCNIFSEETKSNCLNIDEEKFYSDYNIN